MLTRGTKRVRTLTGKEIELDIEPDYKVCFVHDDPAIYRCDPFYIYLTRRRSSKQYKVTGRNDMRKRGTH